MNADYFRTLYAYNSWANRRVLDRAAEVTAEQLRAQHPGLAQGSLFGALVHTVATEIHWLRRWHGESPTTLLSEDDFPTIVALRDRWAEHDATLTTFVTALTDADLVRTIEYRTTQGDPHRDPLFELLAHVVNHGTQFRGEAAVALTALGCSPGNLDLLGYLRSR